MSEREPPDWALPSWDAVPAEAEEGSGRLRPVGPGPGPAVRRRWSRLRARRDRRSAVGPRPPPRRRRPARSASGSSASARSRASIRGAVRSDPRLSDLWVEGEIGRVTISSAGHAYFALKDERNQLQCVWFRDDRLRSAFEAQAGLRVVAHGRIDLFEPQGALQLYVESIQPAGLGDLTLRFEALKARLAAEGLFEAARKRPLPSRPATIAVITSPTGAVWKDICHVLARRWPLTRVVLVAAQVQGESAPASLVGAFRQLERYAAARIAAGRPDEAPAVTILARGGGSLEDLWAFNDEAVVRAVVGPFGAGRLRGRARGRRDAVRLRGRRPRADAVGRRRDRRPGPGRVPRRGPRVGDGAWTARSTMRLRTTAARSSPSDARSNASARSPSSRAPASGSGCCSTGRRGRSSGELAGSAAPRRAARGPPRSDAAGTAGPRPVPARAGDVLDASRGPDAWRSPGPRSGRPRRRSRSSGRRRRSTAATRSSAAPTTAASSATRPRPRPERGSRCGSPQGELPATADER